MQHFAEYVLPSIQQLGIQSGYLFQQDLAKPHTARKTKAWLQQNGIPVLDWVPNTPEINPIEDLWRYLKKEVRKRKPRNNQQLKRILLEEWQKIQISECQ